MKTGFFRRYPPRFHQDDACYDLQTIRDPVLKFSEQKVFLSQQTIFLAFQDAPLGYVLHAEQDGRVGAPFVEHLAGVQAHCALPEVGKFVLDLIAFDHATLGYDFFEQHAKLWNVPLSVTQRIKKSTLRFLGANLECGIEGAARSDDAQLFVEYKNGLVDGVDNALSKRASWFVS
jgi:hypothetical protein